jgi:hypothetical protein
MMSRIVIDILLFLALFMVPWWFVLVLAGIAVLYFDSFFEIIFLGFAIDSLYNASIPQYYAVEFVVTIIAMILFLTIEIVKRRLRWYSGT